jgi:hypothetical protein
VSYGRVVLRIPHGALLLSFVSVAAGCSASGGDVVPALQSSSPPTIAVAADPVAADPDAADSMDEVIVVDTSGLPVSVPSMELRIDRSRSQSGYTMFNLVNVLAIAPGGRPGATEPSGILLVIDDQGRIVGHHTAPQFIGDAQLTPSGSIVYSYADAEAHEVDASGRLLRRWVSRTSREEWTDDLGAEDVPVVRVDTDSIHHEVRLLDNGNLLTLSTELRTVPVPEPLCGEDPATYPGTLGLIGDVIVEIAPDGEIVWQVSMLDVLDPAADPVAGRVCGPLLFGRAFPIGVYDEGGTRRVIDWTHGNSVVLDEQRNLVIASMRHLSGTYAFRHRDDTNGPAGELVWSIAPNGTIELAPGVELPSFQHAVDVLDDGALTMYDNGNEREPQVSRARILDVVDGTLTRRWSAASVIDDVELYSFAVGDVDVLANGNVLVTHGFLFGEPGGLAARIEEIVPVGDEGGLHVFDLRISGGDSGWFVYRAERTPVNPFR